MEASAEQTAIESQRRGTKAVVANAGSGKSTTGGRTILRLFDYERARLYPDRPTLTSEEVEKLLGLFLTSTFTVKAAAEFDEKIKHGLRERGLPIPQRGGKDIRIARTLDSFLQSWLRRRRFFNSWLKLQDGWAFAFVRLVDHLSPAARDFLRASPDGSVSGPNQVLAFYYKMPVLLLGDMQAMVTDILVRRERGPMLPAELMPATILDQFRRVLGSIEPSAETGNWCTQFWQQKLEIWRADQKKHAELYRNFAATAAGMDPAARKNLEQQVICAKRAAAVSERFLNLYQIAKTRSYHPLYSARFLGTQAFLEAFAAAEGIEDEGIETFHRWATAYEVFKRDAGFLDYSDCLEAAVRVFHFDKSLLELERDTPSAGFRHKYVVWDETQDFTPRQLRLAKMLCPSADREGLTLFIGDGKQSIYAFAGSSPYEFARLVKEFRAAGDNVFTLTRSFRSARRIVDLGNEISSTLPSYAATVIPSTAFFEEEGEVNVSPPLLGEETEATWILGKIDTLLQQGDDSIMVLFRNDPDKHPIAHLLRDPKYRKVELLTIHKSKGLQANHVFVGGCTAGRLPVPIGDSLGHAAPQDEGQVPAERMERPMFNDQEVNLFYVCATRARMTVTFVAPTMMRVSAGWGETRDERTGPTPFFWHVPTLRRLCLASGWEEELLEEGVASHEAKVATFYARFFGRIYALNQEAKAGGFKPSSTNENTRARDDTAGLGVHDILREKGAARKGRIGRFCSSRAPATAEGVEAVRKKCLGAFFRNGQAPKLSHQERDVAFSSGWVEQTAGGTLRLTSKLKDAARAG